jgi:hypothetical protein
MTCIVAACASDSSLAPTPQSASADVATATSAAKPAPTGITIRLVVEPQSALGVPFTTAGKKPRDFSLDDNADSRLSNAITFDKLKAGSYTVQAQPVNGLTLAKIVCTTSGGASVTPTTDLASGTATISLDAGESIACSFTELKAWQSGDITTYTQAFWGDDPVTEAFLEQHYNTVYASTLGELDIGISGVTGYHSASWSDASHLENGLPIAGVPGPLVTNYLNTTLTSAGQFLGEVVALKLNVDFSDAGYLPSATGLRFGDLSLCAMSPLTALDGLSVRQGLALANRSLGGEIVSVALSDLNTLAAQLNSSFDSASPNAWARAHLVAGPCP